MKARHLLGMTAMALVALVAYNVALGWLTTNQPAHSLGRRLAAQPRVDFLFVGDSTVDSALNPRQFSQTWSQETGQPTTAFSAALRWSTPVEHYLAARRALQTHPAIPWIVHGIWNFQLTETPSPHWTNHVGNQVFSYYSEPGLAAELYDPGSILSQWHFRLLGHLPMVMERFTVWAKVELLRRYADELGMPSEQSSKSGRMANLDAAMPPQVAAFVQRCETAVQARAPLSEPSLQLLRLARARGIRAVVVSMPMTGRYHRLFYSQPAWRDYERQVRALVEREGAIYVDANGWLLENENFTDTRHLNKTGALRFSEKLAVHLSGLAGLDAGGKK